MGTKRQLKEGQSFRALVPYLRKPVLVHIDHVLPSIYPDGKLIVYRLWSKSKKSWKEFMCYDHEMDWYKDAIKHFTKKIVV